MKTRRSASRVSISKGEMKGVHCLQCPLDCFRSVLISRWTGDHLINRSSMKLKPRYGFFMRKKIKRIDPHVIQKIVNHCKDNTRQSELFVSNCRLILISWDRRQTSTSLGTSIGRFRLSDNPKHVCCERPSIGLDAEKLEDQGHLVHHPNSISQIRSIRCLARIRLIAPLGFNESFRLASSFWNCHLERLAELNFFRLENREDEWSRVRLESRSELKGQSFVSFLSLSEALLMGNIIDRRFQQFQESLQEDSEEKTSSRIIEEHGQSPRWIQIERRRAQRIKNVDQQSVDRRSPRQRSCVCSPTDWQSEWKTANAKRRHSMNCSMSVSANLEEEEEQSIGLGTGQSQTGIGENFHGQRAGRENPNSSRWCSTEFRERLSVGFD